MSIDTRDLILREALSAFDEMGYERATVAQIREAVGVSNGSFFHFFPTKQALASGLFLESLGLYHRSLTRLLVDGVGAAQGVERVITAHLDWVVSQRRRARFMFACAGADWHSHTLPDQTSENRSFGQAIDAWRGPLVASGELVELPRPVFIGQLIGPAQLVCRAWLAGRQDGDPRVHQQDFVDCAVRALVRARPARKRQS